MRGLYMLVVPIMIKGKKTITTLIAEGVIAGATSYAVCEGISHLIKKVKKDKGSRSEISRMQTLDVDEAFEILTEEDLEWANDLDEGEMEAVIEAIKNHGTWYGISDVLIREHKAKMSGLIRNHQSIIDFLSKYSISEADRDCIADSVWFKQSPGSIELWLNLQRTMLNAKVPDWYIWQCGKMMGV